MSCCGRGRQAWKAAQLLKTQASAPPEPVPLDPVSLRYLGTSSLVVTGAATGLVYLFADRDAQLGVDARDVSALLASGRFALAH